MYLTDIGWLFISELYDIYLRVIYDSDMHIILVITLLLDLLGIPHFINRV